MHDVTIHRAPDYTRYTVKAPDIGWYEGWTYPYTTRRVFAVSCTPVRELPAGPARTAILAAMDRETTRESV